MAKNNMNVTKVMNEYAEELASILSVEKRPEIDPLWNTWYEEAYRYEPDGKYDTDTENADDSADDKPETRKDHSGRGNRRDRTEAYKVKFKRNAEVINRNYRKRMMEDMENWSFSKKRGGRRVDNPKSLTMKSDAILKRAEKMMLIESEDAQENTVSQDGSQNTVPINNEQTKVA